MPSYTGFLSDKRLDRRADRIAERMAERQSVVVRQFARNRAEQAAAYRFFANDHVDFDALEEALYSHCGGLAEGGHKLVLQDTTQLNYNHLDQRLDEGLGVIGDNESLGYFLHLSLVLDADTQYCLGLSNIESWTRPADRPVLDKAQRKKRPIEEKESIRWLESMLASDEVLSQADHLTSVADREGDIFEVFARLPSPRRDLLVRSQTDRCIAQQPGTLYRHMAAAAAEGTYEVSIGRDKRRARVARTAQMQVRFARVDLLRPSRLSNSSYPEGVPLYVVDAIEAPESVPAGEDPVHWTLLTSHVVPCFEKACQIIRWYELRWQIEQFFRVLKSQGLNLESSELERGEALRRLGLVSLGAALQVMRLLLVREGDSAQPIGHIFTQPEQQFLRRLLPAYEGKTHKQQNPHAPAHLAWASWLIARLGGWKGYLSQGPPGPITLYRGMKRYASMYEGWRLANP